MGVGADVVGNLFHLFIEEKMPDATQKARTTALWRRIQMYYTENAITDRLTYLKYTMVRTHGNPPKLKSSAAECRALVPFADMLAQEFLSADDPMENSVRWVAHWLHECYRGLRDRTVNMKHASTQLALQYVAVERYINDGSLWRPKPKLHLMLEICAEPECDPAATWTYRDEDFGGSVARAAKSRGAVSNVSSFGRNVLTKFLIKQPMIRIG